MRILMLGNSFTSANNLPGRLSGVLGSEVVAHTRGGARLAEQLNPATRNGSRTLSALSDGGWDFVVMQEMSNGPIVSTEKYLEAVEALAALVRGAGAVPVIYQTWAYEGEAPVSPAPAGDTPRCTTFSPAPVERRRDVPRPSSLPWATRSSPRRTRMRSMPVTGRIRASGAPTSPYG